MPMIEAKVTMQLPVEKRDVLKAEFGKAVSLIGKPESYLMINLIDNQDLLPVEKRDVLKAEFGKAVSKTLRSF